MLALASAVASFGASGLDGMRYATAVLVINLAVFGALWRIRRAVSPPERLKVTGDGQLSCWQQNRWQPVFMLDGSLVFQSFAVVRWRDNRNRYGSAWLHPADNGANWRRLQVIWRWGSRSAARSVFS